MDNPTRIYSLPRWRVTRWLADCGADVPDAIRVELIGNLFSGLPVFFSGVINTVTVAAAIAMRNPTAPFISWLLFEILVCVSRLVVLLVARRAARDRRATPTDLYLVLAIAWSSSVGYGLFVSMTSGDWVASTLAGLSAAAMVGGICFRNFSAPRLAAAMIFTSMGACIPAALIAGEPLLYVAFLQAPLYLGAMGASAFKLNKMLIATMRAERENSHRARHDALTGLANRRGLIEAVEARLTSATASENSVALLFLDLDNFKNDNDTFGHAVGDQLLAQVAERLRCESSSGDVVARIGGDEFVVLIEAPTQAAALAMGERLIGAVACTYALGEGVTAAIGVSIGIAVAPDHANDPEDLLVIADGALYDAKSGGKSRCCMASPMTNLAALRRLRATIAAPARESAAA